jgi:photosynthetic reaction center cytochrome c subunit
MSRHSVVAIVVGLAVSTSTPIAQVAAQQSPFKPPSNLRVLPKDTKLAEIIPVMKSFTEALGVRCQFCHSYTGSDPNALETFDFPGYAVPAKTTARTMMATVQVINGDLLKAVGEPSPAGQSKVTCYTCHRGERTPQTAPGPPR